MNPRKPQGIRHLDSLIALYGMRPLATRLGIYHGSLQHALGIGHIQPGLALKLHREFDIPLKELGH